MKKQAYWSRHPWVCLAGLLLGALAVRLVLAAWYVHDFDLRLYNIPWAIGMREDVFGAYVHVPRLNYPPLFPFLLHFVGDGIAAAKQAGQPHLVMLLVKLFPVLFDVAIIAFVFLTARRYCPERAVPLAALWAMNLSMLLNSSLWGQTDSMLLLFIGLMFVALDRRMPVAACVCFALGCLTKLQMCYFAPVLLLELVTQYRARRWIASLLAGGGVGLLGWLPFLIGARDASLPLRIYLGGADTYRYINLYAANLYGLFGFNMVSETQRVVAAAPITFGTLSRVFTLLSLAGLAAGYWMARRKKTNVPAALHALVWIDAIFLLTTRMHERYQLPVVMLSLVCAMALKRRAFLGLHLAFSAVTFFNQAGRFFQFTEGGVFLQLWRPLQTVCSLFNLGLFVVLLLLYRHAILGKNGGNAPSGCAAEKTREKNDLSS